MNIDALICSVSNFVKLTNIGPKRKSLLLRELREKGSPLLKLTNNHGPLDLKSRQLRFGIKLKFHTWCQRILIVI